MWLAHLLTLSRIPLAALFWTVAPRPGWAILVLAIGGATDLVDGQIARYVRRRREARGEPPPSKLGEWLDPLCDKTFVVAVLVAIWMSHRPPLLLLAAIATRELILVPIAAVYRFTPLLRSRMKYGFRAGILGKATTVTQFAAVAALLFKHPASPVLAVAAAAIGLAAAVGYIRRGVRLWGQAAAPQ